MHKPPRPPEIIAAPEGPYSPPRPLAEVQTIEPVAQDQQGAVPFVQTTVSYPTAAPGRAPSRDWLRWAAKVYYTTNSEQVSIARLRDIPLFAGIDIKSLEAWSARDNWVDLRKENAETWRKQINREIGNHIVRQKKTILDKLEAIHDLMAEKLLETTKKGKGLKIGPKSFEGMVTAYTRVVEKMSEMQDRVYDGVLPDMETVDPTLPADPNSPAKQAVAMTPDQARLLAVQMLRLQNATGQQILPDPEPPTEADDA